MRFADLRSLLDVTLSGRSRRWRLAGALLTVVLLANLFYHGAQSYAVGAVPAPWDKVAHALLHFVLASFLWLAVGPRAWLVIALCAFVAAADETAQRWEPGRSVEFADWLASVIGAALATLAATWLRRQVTIRAAVSSTNSPSDPSDAQSTPPTPESPTAEPRSAAHTLDSAAPDPFDASGSALLRPPLGARTTR